MRKASLRNPGGIAARRKAKSPRWPREAAQGAAARRQKKDLPGRVLAQEGSKEYKKG
jgi:hypothetical protein